MGLAALDVDYKSDAAGVFFVKRVVKTLFLRLSVHKLLEVRDFPQRRWPEVPISYKYYQIPDRMAAVFRGLIGIRGARKKRPHGIAGAGKGRLEIRFDSGVYQGFYRGAPAGDDLPCPESVFNKLLDVGLVLRTQPFVKFVLKGGQGFSGIWPRRYLRYHATRPKLFRCHPSVSPKLRRLTT